MLQCLIFYINITCEGPEYGGGGPAGGGPTGGYPGPGTAGG